MAILSGTQLARESGRLPWPCLYAEKIGLILEKSDPFGWIYGLNSHLKCIFKSILDKIVTRNFCQTVPIPRNLACLEKFLVACLLLQVLDFFCCIWSFDYFRCICEVYSHKFSNFSTRKSFFTKVSPCIYAFFCICYVYMYI